ncbi:hypothetical protein [Jiangella gansuensis]|uniref:hypothetical protein n=1 Tax=Jiangella gansuensis TaxID=281473 RepID=UPI0012F77AC4|nr:hypothetical protein [Jiangella gansuensis]
MSIVLAGAVLTTAGAASAAVAEPPGGAAVPVASLSADRGAPRLPAHIRPVPPQVGPMVSGRTSVVPPPAVTAADDGDDNDPGWGWGPSRVIWAAFGWLALVIVAAILLRRLVSRRR